ncbi:Hpt domain-containing protein, partial [Rubrivivax gelatinosus]|uniref:Hpt domain-containing protein n=1 Tax=Rubrivivax gelatinosus TaxID=28068 RepID=UPI002872F7A6
MARAAAARRRRHHRPRAALPQLLARLRDWADNPADSGAAAACMRTLHTFKGGARLAGAMRLGERAHRMETAIERLGDRG